MRIRHTLPFNRLPDHQISLFLSLLEWLPPILTLITPSFSKLRHIVVLGPFTFSCVKMANSGRMFIVWMTVMGFLTLTRGQLTEPSTTGNCSIAPVACYLNTPYPVALRPGLNCTVLLPPRI